MGGKPARTAPHEWPSAQPLLSGSGVSQLHHANGTPTALAPPLSMHPPEVPFSRASPSISRPHKRLKPSVPTTSPEASFSRASPSISTTSFSGPPPEPQWSGVGDTPLSQRRCARFAAASQDGAAPGRRRTRALSLLPIWCPAQHLLSTSPAAPTLLQDGGGGQGVC